MVDSTMTGTSSSLIQRMIRAARLEPALYEEVEADRTATSTAAVAVTIVAVAAGIGSAIGFLINSNPNVSVNPVLAVVGSIISALIGWLIWSYVAWFVGTKLFGGTATPGELLRTIGFAQSPGVLNVLSFIPIVGGFVAIITGIWSLVAGVVAVRQALDFDTGKAIMTTVVGWIFLVIVVVLITAVVGGAAVGLGAMTGAGS